MIQCHIWAPFPKVDMVASVVPEERTTTTATIFFGAIPTTFGIINFFYANVSKVYIGIIEVYWNPCFAVNYFAVDTKCRPGLRV